MNCILSLSRWRWIFSPIERVSLKIAKNLSPNSLIGEEACENRFAWIDDFSRYLYGLVCRGHCCDFVFFSTLFVKLRYTTAISINTPTLSRSNPLVPCGYSMRVCNLKLHSKNRLMQRPFWVFCLIFFCCCWKRVLAFIIKIHNHCMSKFCSAGSSSTS